MWTHIYKCRLTYVNVAPHSLHIYKCSPTFVYVCSHWWIGKCCFTFVNNCLKTTSSAHIWPTVTFVRVINLHICKCGLTFVDVPNMAPEHQSTHNACAHHLTLLNTNHKIKMAASVSVTLVIVYLSAGGATFATELLLRTCVSMT